MKSLLLYTMCIFLLACSKDSIELVDITDDENPDMLIGGLGVPEANKSYSIDVYLSKPAISKVEFEYRFESGTAESGLDFAPATSFNSILPNQERTSITFNIKDDQIEEELETFNIVLYNITNANVIDSIGIIRIKDND